jgi:hypothetical protein
MKEHKDKKGGEWKGPKWNPIHTRGADIWLYLGQASVKFQKNKIKLTLQILHNVLFSCRGGFICRPWYFVILGNRGLLGIEITNYLPKKFWKGL